MRYGLAGGVRLVLSRCNELRRERKGAAGLAASGKACYGEQRHGVVRQVWNGLTMCGELLLGVARSGRYGGARLGAAWFGMDRRSRQAWSLKGGNNLIYQWKLPGLMPVDAQTAGEELQRIYQEKGRLDAPDIVDESRPVDAPLHPCFEWNDVVAAEKYRETQAQNIVRSVVVVHENQSNEPVEVRAFVNVQETYRPIEVVVNSEEQMKELLKSAFSELKSFEKKYAALSQLAPVFEAIQKLSA